MYKFTKKMNIK